MRKCDVSLYCSSSIYIIFSPVLYYCLLLQYHKFGFRFHFPVVENDGLLLHLEDNEMDENDPKTLPANQVRERKPHVKINTYLCKGSRGGGEAMTLIPAFVVVLTMFDDLMACQVIHLIHYILGTNIYKVMCYSQCFPRTYLTLKTRYFETHVCDTSSVNPRRTAERQKTRH